MKVKENNVHKPKLLNMREIKTRYGEYYITKIEIY